MSKYKFIKIEDEDINEIEDKIYLIPMYNLKTLEKKLNKMRNKGANIEYEDLGEERVADNNGRYHLCKKIKVSGHYQINGWEFIATIEHSGNDGENVIRKITDDPIPDKFWTAKPYCEHCKAERNRRDTYLVKNINTGEIKQVGRQCLQDYTGLDASVAASYASILKELDAELSALADDEVLSMMKGPKYVGDDTDQVKKVMFRYIKENGYNKDQILNHIYNIFQEGFDKYIQDGPDYSQDIENMNKWVNELDASSNDYIRNAKSVWNKAVIEERDWKILASFIASYLKDVQRRSEGTNTQYNSNKVGDKITITIKSLRILFRSGTQFGISYTYRIIGEDGLIYIYKTSKELHEGDTISAIISEFTEYRGEKQTIIKTTRTGVVAENQFKIGYKFKDNFKGKYYKIISMDPIICEEYSGIKTYYWNKKLPKYVIRRSNFGEIKFDLLEEFENYYKHNRCSECKNKIFAILPDDFEFPQNEFEKYRKEYESSHGGSTYQNSNEACQYAEDKMIDRFIIQDSKYLFIKLTDAKDLNYVYKLKFVYKDKDGSLKRVSKDKIEQHYNKLKGKYSDAQVYYMILRADEDCDRYIELHKDDKSEEFVKKEVEPTKEKFKGSKQEYIEKMIAKGYSEEDAEELAENAYGGD